MTPLCVRTVLAAVLLVACDRTHMSPSYGVAERNAFSSQIVDPDAGAAKKPDQPLDPTEAAAIASSYQQSLVKEQPTTDPNAIKSQFLIVPNPKTPTESK